MQLRSYLLAALSLFQPTAAADIYTLSLHDALPIFRQGIRTSHEAGADLDRLHGRQGRGDQGDLRAEAAAEQEEDTGNAAHAGEDRKSTRLNSSHVAISYAVFCLKKKKKTKQEEKST